jgi:hypothetical protein
VADVLQDAKKVRYAFQLNLVGMDETAGVHESLCIPTEAGGDNNIGGMIYPDEGSVY